MQQLGGSLGFKELAMAFPDRSANAAGADGAHCSFLRTGRRPAREVTNLAVTEQKELLTVNLAIKGRTEEAISGFRAFLSSLGKPMLWIADLRLFLCHLGWNGPQFLDANDHQQLRRGRHIPGRPCCRPVPIQVGAIGMLAPVPQFRIDCWRQHGHFFAAISSWPSARRSPLPIPRGALRSRSFAAWRCPAVGYLSAHHPVLDHSDRLSFPKEFARLHRVHQQCWPMQQSEAW